MILNFLVRVSHNFDVEIACLDWSAQYVLSFVFEAGPICEMIELLENVRNG